MADQDATTEAQATPPAAPETKTPNDAAQQTQRMFTQDEFDKKLGARLAAEREKFADYDDLKTKAEAHDTITAERDALKAELDAAKAEGLRQRIASEHGIPVELLNGSDEESLTASAQALAAFAESKQGPVGPVVKSVGTGDPAPSRDEAAAAFLASPRG